VDWLYVPAWVGMIIVMLVFFLIYMLIWPLYLLFGWSTRLIKWCLNCIKALFLLHVDVVYNIEIEFFP